MLRQASKAWISAALDFLGHRLLPTKDDIEVIFNENGYSTRPVKIRDVSLICMAYGEQLFNLPEYSNIVRLVIDTPTLVSNLFVDASGNFIMEPEQQENWLKRYFDTLLYEYLKKKSDLSFSSDVFNQLYEQLEKYIYASCPFLGIWSVYIRNLRVEEDNIKIKGGVCLRRATHEEKVSAVRALSHPTIFSGIPDIPEVFLDIYQQVDRATLQKSVPTSQDITPIAERLLLALRLLKPQPVGIAWYRWDVPEQPFGMCKGVINSMMLRYSDYQGEPYQLTGDDVDELLVLWRSTKQALNEPELAIALSRFGDS